MDSSENENSSNRIGCCQRLLLGQKSPTPLNPRRQPSGFLRIFPQTSESLPRLYNRCGKGLIFMEHRRQLCLSEPITWRADGKMIRTSLKLSAIPVHDRPPHALYPAANDPAKPRRFSGTSVPESFSF